MADLHGRGLSDRVPAMEEVSQAAPAASTQANDEGAVYEVGFHVLPTVAESEAAAVAARVRALLGDAEIIKEETPRKITFAYVIERSAAGKREKYTEGYFGFIKFATQPQMIPALQEALRADREILRFIVIETVREDITAPRHAVFSSDRLEGQTLKKPTSAPEARTEVSEEELEKSLEALTQ